MRRAIVLAVLSIVPGFGDAAETPAVPEIEPIDAPRESELPPAPPQAEPAPAALTATPVPPVNLSGRGLFDFQDPSPFAVLHLELPVDTLEVIEEGRGKLELGFKWANNFAIDDTFVIDAETYLLNIGGWYALRKDFYIGATVPLIARGGGILDPLIDSVHDTFHFGNGQREKRGTNDYEISILEANGKVEDLNAGVGIGDLVLQTHWNLNPGDDWFPAVSLEGLMSVPTSMRGFGSTGVDVGLAVSFYKTFWNRLHLYAVLGGTYLTDATTEGIHYERELYEAVAGAEVRVGRKFSIIAQYMSFSPLLESPTPLNKKRNYVAGGFKWEILAGLTLELSIVENLYPFTSSADIVFSTGFSFRL